MTVEFETLEDYLILAKRVIAKLAPKFYQSLAMEMLKDEDAISDVANAIMVADWKWNPGYRSQTNTVRSKRSYRNQRAIWAMKKYISNKRKSKGTMSLSYENKDQDNPVMASGMIEDKKSQDPAIVAENRETIKNSKSLVSQLLATENITEKQKKYIISYYLEGHTLQEVGDKYGVSREAIRQGINSGIDTIKKVHKGV